MQYQNLFKKPWGSLLFLLLFFSSSVYAAPPVRPMPCVGVEKVALLDSAEEKRYVGRVKASEEVAITSKITGTLWKVCFKEGAYVKKGDLLFEIEDTVFKANLDIASAQLKQLQAELIFARKEYERQRSLMASNATAVTNYESHLRTHESSKAKIEEAKAKVRLCQNDLSYTKIYAPVNGKIGETSVNAGNEIAPTTGRLATIMNFDPIKIQFAISEKDFFLFFKKGKVVKNHIRILRADGKEFRTKVNLDFYDNQVDPATGTILIQLSAANKNMFLVPGGYVTIYFQRFYPSPLPAVPLSALLFDGKDYSVFVVKKDNTLEKRIVKTGELSGNKQLILEGLSKGEKIVVTGLHKVMPGIKVNGVEEKK